MKDHLRCQGYSRANYDEALLRHTLCVSDKQGLPLSWLFQNKQLTPIFFDIITENEPMIEIYKWQWLIIDNVVIDLKINQL